MMNGCRIALATGLVALLAGAALPDHARALDLETALRQVAAANPTLAAHRSMVEAARRRVSMAGAWTQPMVELGVVNVPTTGRYDRDPMTMKMVGISQRVPVFGGNRLARRAATEVVKSESDESRMTAYELFGATWEAYADAYYAGQLARYAMGHQGIMDRLVRSGRARYESGAGRLEDVLRSESERARTLTDFVAFRAEEQGARARLDALRGVSPGSGNDSLAPPPDVLPAEAAPWLETVGADHPRLRGLDAQAAQYRWSARASRRMLWPDLELRGSYGFREALTGGVDHEGTPITTPMPQDNMFSASVGFMLPIFAGRERSEAAAMDAMSESVLGERRAAELSLREQIVAAHTAAAAAHRTERLLADTVVVSLRRATDASWSAYTAGSVDLWRVFESTHALYMEEIALIRARQDLAHAQSRLISITGQGAPLGIALPTIEENSR